MVRLSVLKLRLSATTVELIEGRLRRQGDLSRLIQTVLDEVDWSTIVPYDRRFLRDAWKSGSTNTSVSLPADLQDRLKAHAEKLNTSAGRVIEGAVIKWAEDHPIDKIPG